MGEGVNGRVSAEPTDNIWTPMRCYNASAPSTGTPPTVAAYLGGAVP